MCSSPKVSPLEKTGGKVFLSCIVKHRNINVKKKNLDVLTSVLTRKKLRNHWVYFVIVTF